MIISRIKTGVKYFLLSALVPVSFYCGWQSNRFYSFFVARQAIPDVCKLDGRYISPRELKGCETMLSDIHKALQGCEWQLKEMETKNAH